MISGEMLSTGVLLESSAGVGLLLAVAALTVLVVADYLAHHN